jgi:REase_MTES_1575/Putative DNA-binding domain
LWHRIAFVSNYNHRPSIDVDQRKQCIIVQYSKWNKYAADGPSFYSAKSALERDVTRQEFLESKGWHVERVWSRSWWRDPDKEINRIHQSIQGLRKIKPADDSLANLIPTEAQNQEHENKQSRLEIEEEVIEELIKNGESDAVEFKASMIWDYKLNKPNKAVLWQPILKNIVAFMNSEGGSIILGIADSGEVTGLERDFEALGKKKSWDEWIQHFVNIFNEYIGKEYECKS